MLNFHKTKLTADFFNSSDYSNYILKFANYFEEWIDELYKKQTLLFTL